jgi:hypothetical protein
LEVVVGIVEVEEDGGGIEEDEEKVAEDRVVD